MAAEKGGGTDYRKRSGPVFVNRGFFDNMGPNPGDYSEKTYGERILKLNLKIFNVTIRETDLFIITDFDLIPIPLYVPFISTVPISKPTSRHPLFF